MGNRLSKIYTKTGDTGKTALANGDRIDKDDLQIAAMGDVDELNSFVGLLLSETFSNPLIRTCLIKSQHTLFDLGGEIAMPAYQAIKDEAIQALEQAIDALNETLPPLKDFILPSGDKPTCYAHLARSICRRAERKLVSLNKSRQLSENSLKYLNRLSDFLFVTARILAKADNLSETLWDHERK